MTPAAAPLIATFSIVALDPATCELGVGVASKFLAVGAAVPWARSGAGAVATQAWANLSYGPEGLALLEQGLGAEEVVRRLTEADQDREHRQVGVVDRTGGAAAWTGRECFRWAGHRTGRGYTCQGNILTGEAVVTAMAATFEHSSGPLPERLVTALEAGQAEGGDSRGQQSAALYVVKEKGGYGGWLDRYIDLRVDDHPTPIAELRKLLELHRLYFGATVPQNLTRLAGNVAGEVQEILRRLGFYDGEITGVYDLRTKEAFRRFCAVENFEERWRDDDFADREILTFMRKRYGAPADGR
ncbi:MAG: DUF1028 domain-containing protein [Armatimonadota bacterium]|nr:DUF1028 domain-containing protein [Armatimonadota bacterium]MDR7450684.1 DUF1028 domain-containing protein [Armatimonadota bacterium]MDR7466040.1 DUF1028 domain-containing protein [Armatimonadota bacterium]MDR7493923.1 DUF1028 domain-containing protein [Armatimonadota bacterium]MDR7504028.1 DUF1028 domain-containing protein [Armatimonadota bacterium]